MAPAAYAASPTGGETSAIKPKQNTNMCTAINGTRDVVLRREFDHHWGHQGGDHDVTCRGRQAGAE
jgi:hypothetical protein